MSIRQGAFRIPEEIPNAFLVPFLTPHLKSYSCACLSLKTEARAKLFDVMDRMCEEAVAIEAKEEHQVNWVELSERYYDEFVAVVTAEGAATDPDIFQNAATEKCKDSFYLSKMEEALYTILGVAGEMGKDVLAILDRIGATEVFPGEPGNDKDIIANIKLMDRTDLETALQGAPAKPLSKKRVLH